MQDLFVYQREGVASDGKVLGHFRPTGVRPGFADKLAVRGIDLSGLLFFDEKQRLRDEEKAGW